MPLHNVAQLQTSPQVPYIIDRRSVCFALHMCSCTAQNLCIQHISISASHAEPPPPPLGG